MDYQDTIHNAIEKYTATIADAATPAELHALFRQVWADFETLWNQGSQLPGNDTACQPGCVYCCHYTVSLKAHEIVQLLEHLRQHLSKTEINEVLSRAKANRKLIKKQTHEQIEHTNIRCPLLSDEGLCRCYEARPLNCRRNNSRNAELCRDFYEHPDSTLSADSAQDIDQLTGIIGYALNEAFAQNGYDDTIYYLNNALYQGLTRPGKIKRWYHQKTTFSRAAESKEFD